MTALSTVAALAILAALTIMTILNRPEINKLKVPYRFALPGLNVYLLGDDIVDLLYAKLLFDCVSFHEKFTGVDGTGDAGTAEIVHL
jgi:hypothetical protein